MNIPITKEQAARLDKKACQSFYYGSRLFKVHNKLSDYDMIILYRYDDVFKESVFLPNIHSFQYSEGNVDKIYMTYEQFWNSFYTGDGTMYADIILFSYWFPEELALNYCRAYKIIKGYCGTAKRDALSNIKKEEKIFRRCAKNLYIARCLIDNKFPDIKEIQKIYKKTYTKEFILETEEAIRKSANELFNSNKLDNFYIPVTEDDLLNIMLHGNNLKQYIFKK